MYQLHGSVRVPTALTHRTLDDRVGRGVGILARMLAGVEVSDRQIADAVAGPEAVIPESEASAAR